MGQAPRKLVDRGFDALRHVAGVLADGHQDDGTDGLAAVLLQDAAPRSGGERHARHVLDANRRSYEHALQVADDRFVGFAARRAQGPQGAHQVLRVPLLDDAPTDGRVGARNGIDDLRRGHAMPPHPRRVDGNGELDHRPPDAGDLGHPRHGRQPGLDDPILDRAQASQVLAVALDRVPEDLAGRRRVRTEAGRHSLR